MSEKELKDIIKQFIYSGDINISKIIKTFKTSLSHATELLKKINIYGYFINSTSSSKQFNLSFYKEIEKLIIDELFVLKPIV